MVFGQNLSARNGYNSYGDECDECETFNKNGDIIYEKTMWRAIAHDHVSCLAECIDNVQDYFKPYLLKYALEANSKECVKYLQAQNFKEITTDWSEEVEASKNEAYS